MFDQRRNLDMTILDDLQRMADADLMSGGMVFNPIRVDSKVKTSQVKRKLLTEAFPKCKAREDYRTLALDIAKRVVSLEATAKSMAQMKDSGTPDPYAPLRTQSTTRTDRMTTI
jgi:nitrogenase subunit NifH